MKTYKCRNNHNLSPLVNQEFDPRKILKESDPKKLYEPRVNAYETIKMHLDNVEEASSAWLHNRSLNAFEKLINNSISMEEHQQHMMKQS